MEKLPEHYSNYLRNISNLIKRHNPLNRIARTNGFCNSRWIWTRNAGKKRIANRTDAPANKAKMIILIINQFLSSHWLYSDGPWTCSSKDRSLHSLPSKDDGSKSPISDFTLMSFLKWPWNDAALHPHAPYGPCIGRVQVCVLASGLWKTL